MELFEIGVEELLTGKKSEEQQKEGRRKVLTRQEAKEKVS